MLAAVLWLGLASAARAQAPAAPAAAPAASTGTAVAASTDTAVSTSSGTAAPEVQGYGIKVGGEQPAAILANPIAVHVHKEARDWEPISMRVGGDPGQAGNSFTRRIKTVRVKGTKKTAGQSSKATAVARAHPLKGDTLLIISLYPASLKASGAHIEVRYLISEGWLEEAKVAAVTVRAGQPGYRHGAEDSVTLAMKGIEFREDFPSEGDLRVSALDPKVGKSARNAGRVSGADFGGAAYGEADLGLVNLSYSAKGVEGAPGRAKNRVSK